jgi:hypothetical protein
MALNTNDERNEEQLLDTWYQLLAEQRAMMKFIWAKGDAVITYNLISANMVLPRLPGDDKSEVVSDRTIAKYSHPLEEPPLELTRRLGKRSGIQLTAVGVRLMRLIAKKHL